MVNWLAKIWNEKAWPLLRLMAACWILLSIFGYFSGVKIGFIIAPFFITGIWAIEVVGVYLKPLANMPKAVGLFALVYIITVLTIYTIGKHTLLGAYEDWAIFDRTVFGAIRIFAPYIVLTLGSIFFAVTSAQMLWPKRLVALSMVIMIICLMLHEIVEAYDKWAATYLTKKTQEVEADRLEMINELGLMARPKNNNVKVYHQDPTTLFFNADTDPLTPDIRYLYIERNGEKQDGMYTLICIMLPDKNGEFTSRSKIGWVRNSEVSIEPRSADKFCIKKISQKFWEVTFYTDEPVRVLDTWAAGTTIHFSGPTSSEKVMESDPAGGGEMFPLPIGYSITRHANSPLVLQYKKWGKINMTFD